VVKERETTEYNPQYRWTYRERAFSGTTKKRPTVEWRIAGPIAGPGCEDTGVLFGSGEILLVAELDWQAGYYRAPGTFLPFLSLT
jgi:hypothetical protein